MNTASLSYCEIAKTIDVIDLPMFVISIKGDLITFGRINPCYERTVGLRNRDIAGKTAYELLPERTAEAVEKNWRHCLKTRTPFKYQEVIQTGAQECWWETTLSPVFDESGIITHIIGSAQDVTGDKHAIMDGVKDLATALKRNEEMQVFMTMAAHDLRPAIGNIKAINALVLANFTDLGDRKIDQVRLVGEIADGALDTIEKTLHYARMIGLKKTASENLHLSHCISDIAALTDPTGALTMTCPDVEIVCEAVPTQMILRNLIENATRFAKNHIGISVTKSAERPGQLVFRVSDDGPGFAGAESGFSATLRANADKYATTGFGLVAINQLVEQRGGAFWLSESRLPGGATLCFSLPGTIVQPKRTRAPLALAG